MCLVFGGNGPQFKIFVLSFFGDIEPPPRLFYYQCADNGTAVLAMDMLLRAGDNRT